MIYLQISEFDELPCNICPNCIYMCTSWVSFKQLCEQTDATLKKHLNLIKTSKKDFAFEPLESFEIIQVKPDQSNSVPEDISTNDVQTIKNETPFDNETNDYENNLEDDQDLTSDSEDEEDEDEELSSSSVEYKTKKNLKTKILQPKKSYYKPKNEFTCTTCIKTFRNAERLEAHMRQHLGQKV